MKREITTHKVNGLNEALEIEVLDEPGHGGACREYNIHSVAKSDVSDPARLERLCRASCRIHFQNGPINEEGVNGISNEALLAIVQDRLHGFQSGQHACEANEKALVHIVEAIRFLNLRTRERVARGVEGTHAV